MSIWTVFSGFFTRAGKKMCLDCRDYIEKNSKILDLGCGSGLIGEAFADFFGAELEGVDVKDYRACDISFKLFDGENIPYPDKSFDATLINYVLHHSLNPVKLLEEAGRVTKDIIVVYEDLPEGFWSNLSSKIHSGLTLLLHRGANIPEFKTEKEWKEVFKKLGFKPVFEKRISNFPSKRHLFILRV
jgi:ubiquinone/menaquinone biosynthesis C-methylase UbiE